MVDIPGDDSLTNERSLPAATSTVASPLLGTFHGWPDDDVEADCYTTVPINASGDLTVETLQININIEAALVSNSEVKMQMNQVVRVRNDRVRVW